MEKMRPNLLSILILCLFAVGQGINDARAQDSDVTEFVRTVFIEGVPYERANQYGADAVPTLTPMLNDTNEEPHWARVAMVLGVIGDEAAVDALIDFLNAETAQALSPAQFKGKTSALASLGYAISKTGNPALFGSTSPSLAATPSCSRCVKTASRWTHGSWRATRSTGPSSFRQSRRRFLLSPLHNERGEAQVLRSRLGPPSTLFRQHPSSRASAAVASLAELSPAPPNGSVRGSCAGD